MATCAPAAAVSPSLHAHHRDSSDSSSDGDSLGPLLPRDAAVTFSRLPPSNTSIQPPKLAPSRAKSAAGLADTTRPSAAAAEVASAASSMATPLAAASSASSASTPKVASDPRHTTTTTTTTTEASKAAVKAHLLPADVAASTPPPISSSSPGSGIAAEPGRVSVAAAHASLPPTPDQSLPPAVLKTSPGLAARLRALGLGGSNKAASSSASRSDSVGRLDQDQLRQLDEKLQAASAASTVIARRGRPWKNALFKPSERRRRHPPPRFSEIMASKPLAMGTQSVAFPQHGRLDARHDYLRSKRRSPSPEDAAWPPPPPPKDTPPLSTTSPSADASGSNVADLDSNFTPGRKRPTSIYTLSRVSFASQLSQLTSLQLPDAESLASKVSAIRSTQVAAKALINAAEQIRDWISKAQDVIGGLDGDDDVEWAAAGGREGLEEVENAISRFEDLINVYVGAIEELQGRSDITTVPSDDLRHAVGQMESILDEWTIIRATLHGVRTQVEMAMEWEELWSNVLGDIQTEVDHLSRLVFEMEERRHRTMASAAGSDGVDFGDLETIVEDSPGAGSRLQATNRLSIVGSLASLGLSLDDSSLLALFARMQPLRASLDFLSMRLAGFEARADKAFPTACHELASRRDGLDASYRKLEKDAEALRKELGEDRWVIVFRGAGRQAQKMLDSVQRSLLKLWEALDAGLQMTSPVSLGKKIEGYDAKRHYGPAIERVLAIIDKGIKDRLTVNGEILRLLADTQSRWDALKLQMREMDAVLDDFMANRKSQRMRDSVSSMLSNDRSTLGSGHETPGSSPPSSIIMSNLGLDLHTPATKLKGRSPTGGSAILPSAGQKHSSLPAPMARQQARKAVPRLSTITSSSVATPASASSDKTPRLPASLANRPRWNTSTNVTGLDASSSSKPSSFQTPNSLVRTTPGGPRYASTLSPPSMTGSTRLPTPRNAFPRGSSESPSVRETPSRTSHPRMPCHERLTSPGPQPQQQSLSKSRLLSSKCSMSALWPTRRRDSGNRAGSDSSLPEENPVNRPASSLVLTGCQTSLLPLPAGKEENRPGRVTPRLSSTSGASTRKSVAAEAKDAKPKWRR